MHNQTDSNTLQGLYDFLEDIMRPFQPQVKEIKLKQKKVLSIVDNIGELKYSPNSLTSDIVQEMRENDFNVIDVTLTDGNVDIDFELRFSSDHEYSNVQEEDGSFEFKEAFEVENINIINVWKGDDEVTYPDTLIQQVETFINTEIKNYTI